MMAGAVSAATEGAGVGDGEGLEAGVGVLEAGVGVLEAGVGVLEPPPPPVEGAGAGAE